MFQLRIHGRGGQGVVTAAELVSIAAFTEGKHAQAFPSFGSERMGAPVVAYARIDTAPIEITEPVMRPDLLIIQDPTLFHAVDVFTGLMPDGFVLINTGRPLAELRIEDAVDHLPPHHVATVPATELALEHLGRPTPNTVLLGALTALTDVLRLDSVIEAIGEKFAGAVAQRNVEAARAAYESCAS